MNKLPRAKMHVPILSHVLHIFQQHSMQIYVATIIILFHVHQLLGLICLPVFHVLLEEIEKKRGKIL